MSLKRHRERILAEVVELILRRPGDEVSIEGFAQHAGYTRRQLERMFIAELGESPSKFRARIRMEMAWWHCAQKELTIQEIAHLAGFDSASGFSRAFRSHWGFPPIQAQGMPPEKPQHNQVRWIPQWTETNDGADRWAFKGFTLQFVLRPAMRFARFTVTGSYSNLGDSWARLHERLCKTGFDLKTRRCMTRYLDTLWTHPKRDNTRAHLYIELHRNELPPCDGQLINFPHCQSLQTDVLLRREHRNDAWLQVMGAWQEYSMGMDEYGNSPVPWDSVLTRICLILGRGQRDVDAH